MIMVNMKDIVKANSKQFEQLMKHYTYKKVKAKNGGETYKFTRKPSSERKFLTRWEIWEAIRRKYFHMKHFNIEAPFKNWGWYVTRTDLFNLMLEMKIHKSRHLTKEQKLKVVKELELRETTYLLQKL